MGNLEEADEEGVDLNMPELLEDDDDEDEEGEENQGGEEPPTVRTSSRGNRGVPPTRYHDVFELASDITSPPTVAMALGGEKGAEWAAAMEAELDSLWENGVYEEVPRPSGKVIGTKWVMRVKMDASGNREKYIGWWRRGSDRWRG